MMRITLLSLLAFVLLACGQDEQANAPTPPAPDDAPTPPALNDGPEAPAVPVAASAVEFAIHGDTLVEEKILNSNVIVRATMSSFSSDVITYIDSKRRVVLKFNLTVHEYLKGTGSAEIVATWIDGFSYDTSAEANTAKRALLAERDAQWDDREAIIFLSDATTGFGRLLDTYPQFASDYFLGLGFYGVDRYSLSSIENKRWLPAASGTGATGGDKKFLLDVPAASEGVAGASSSAATPSITLGALKKRITEITAEFNGGDGSAAYKECVQEKYRHQRGVRYFKELDGSDFYDKSPVNTTLASGQPAKTTLDESKNYGIYPDAKAKTWFEGTDAALFSVVQGKTTPYDIDRDGKFTAVVDGIEFTETLMTARPLPAGTYKVNRREVWASYLACNFILDHHWTITVTAPAGTVHEAFFDPVSIGGAVGADAENGVLKPRAFTGASGASATLRSISYSAGAVTISVTPVDALAGHVVDFIGMDGAVGLSLHVADATVDGGGGTLRWPSASAPWASGDTLMVRVRAAV